MAKRRSIQRFHGSPTVGDLAALLGETTIKQHATDFAVLGATAGLGIIGGRLIRKQGLDRLTFIPDIAKPFILALLGVGAGLGVRKVDLRAGTGLAAGMIGEAICELVVGFVPQLGRLSAVTEEQLLYGVGALIPGDRLLGDGSTPDEEEIVNELLSGPAGARQYDVEVGGFEVQEGDLPVSTGGLEAVIVG